MNNSNYNLPTPQTLIKKAKEETIPVSLRVKESTVALFDKMAKEAGVNRGTMMNTWLDFYAESQGSTKEDNSIDIMTSYLGSDRYCKSIPSLSIEEIMYRIASIKSKNFGLNGLVNARILYKAYTEKDVDDNILNFHIGDDIIIASDNATKCESDGEDVFMFIKKEQWPIVAVMLGEYVAKYEKLFPDQEYVINTDTYKKIAYFCNNLDNLEELGNAISAVLLEYVVTQNG